MSRPVDTQVVAYYTASGLDGTPCVFASVAIFGNFGLLVVMLSDPGLREATVARFLLHTFIVADLASCGISNLLAGPALAESSGNQYFQHLLGYRARNLRFSTTR